jgi:Tol biopolymer transport system component
MVEPTLRPRHAAGKRVEPGLNRAHTARRDPGAVTDRRIVMARPRSTIAIALAGIAMTPGAAPAAATSSEKEGRIAFGLTGADGNTDVYSVRPDGHALRRLTDSPGFDACPAYARGGRHIAFCSDRTGAPETWVMRENGSDERQVTNLGGALTFPDFSPDGRRIAMSGRAPEDPAQARDLWITNIDGSGMHRLTDTPDSTEQWPAYSPDGTRIAFVSNRGGGVPQIWVIDADGNDPQQLTSDPLVKEQVPDWSPDGARIAYAAAGDIWAMRADGSHQVQLTHTAEPEGGAAWSPGGRRIAFLRTGALGRLVHTMAADGTDVRVVRTEGPAFVPAWQLPARPCQ